MKNLFLISRQTFMEIYQSKILMNVLFMGVLLWVVTFVAAEFSYGVADKIALDVGLGCLYLSLIGVAIFMGANLINDEIENRTLYMIICRPVSRSSFFVGKMLGLSGILLVNTMALSVFIFGLYYFLGGSYHYLIPWSLFFIYLEAVLILFCVVFFSLISNTALTVLITLVVLVAGHGIEGVKSTSFYSAREWVRVFVDNYSYYMPNLEKFNIKSFVLYDSLLDSAYLFSSLSYSIIWIALFLVLSLLVISRKDFS
jgi:ABC-type transport system involved in multi-copper enzyme maturation permease subunit